MKKRISLLVLLTVAALAMGCVAQAAGLSFGIGSYDPPELDIATVAPIDPIEAPSISYDAPEIESATIAPIDPIEVPDISYEAPEIEFTTIAPIDPIEVPDISYEAPEIEFTTVAPIDPIEVPSLSYEAPEIEFTTIAPIDPIEVPNFSYEAHDITNLLPAEIQPLYVSIVGYLGDVDRAELNGLSDIEIADFVTREYEIIGLLRDAFADLGIVVRINPYTGMLAINSSLLYATDAYQVTDTGKQVLATVFKVYCDVLGREEYRDHVSQVLIVGHTDNAGSYDYNVELSRRRADAVRDFVLSPECGVADLDWLTPRLTAEGHSYDELIYNADGTVNMAASRRVEIGFRLAVE